MIEDPYKNHIIFQKYLVKNRIGKGSFGTVYSGIITQTHEKIAIKFEKREKGKNGTLETEACRLIYYNQLVIVIYVKKLFFKN